MTPPELDQLTRRVSRLERIVAALNLVYRAYTDVELNDALEKMRQEIESK